MERTRELARENKAQVQVPILPFKASDLEQVISESYLVHSTLK